MAFTANNPHAHCAWTISMEEMERYFACPCCGENISMLLDLSEAQQQYIEDCEVCCQPIEIKFTVEDNSLQSWSASGSDA